MEEAKEEEKQCRLCFQGSEYELCNPLLTPCDCRGSQKYVHLRCLEKWQNLCLSSGSADASSRALVCSVCRGEFSWRTSKLPSPANAASQHASNFFTSICRRSSRDFSAFIDKLQPHM
mmetsp:Transcript_116/g.224  ORF Transcript_116/g.224 Transcript_116/m.224 type:complete len:118 (-) Transcript_116:40-393(-)